jgi:hypothetical protein
MNPVYGTARSANGSVKVVVGPGGVLRSVELTAAALDDGPSSLAAAVLAVTRVATAEANQRMRNRLRAELTGLPADSVRALGFTDDSDVVDRVESTVPDTWRDF